MFKKTLIAFVLVCFSTSLVVSPVSAQTLLGLPEPGQMVSLSAAYQPAIIRGMTVHADNPFLFDFIVDTGNDKLAGDALKKEGEKLVKYFLACLTLPEQDL